LHLTDANDIEREAIGAESVQCLFVRLELKLLTTNKNLKHAITGDDVGYFSSRRTTSLDEPIEKSRVPEPDKITF